jgi:hypothetical protein
MCFRVLRDIFKPGPIRLPAVKKEAEKALVLMSSMSESHWWCLFHKEMKS